MGGSPTCESGPSDKHPFYDGLHKDVKHEAKRKNPISGVLSINETAVGKSDPGVTVDPFGVPNGAVPEIVGKYSSPTSAPLGSTKGSGNGTAALSVLSA